VMGRGGVREGRSSGGEEFGRGGPGRVRRSDPHTPHTHLPHSPPPSPPPSGELVGSYKGLRESEARGPPIVNSIVAAARQVCPSPALPPSLLPALPPSLLPALPPSLSPSFPLFFPPSCPRRGAA
jgi:hypothetical protein